MTWAPRSCGSTQPSWTAIARWPAGASCAPTRVGRLKSPEGWQLDFGIADADGLLHASVTDLAQRLPAAEREHWAQHLVTPAISRNFLTMRLVPGSCIDDGDLRDLGRLISDIRGIEGVGRHVD